jgi:hypothetical protein
MICKASEGAPITFLKSLKMEQELRQDLPKCLVIGYSSMMMGQFTLGGRKKLYHFLLCKFR